MYPTTALIHALPFAERRVCSREEAASYVGVSPGKFDKLVTDGTMPPPLPYGRAKRWDKLALDRVINDLAGSRPVYEAKPTESHLPTVSGHTDSNEWDEVIVDAQERPTAKRH